MKKLNFSVIGAGTLIHGDDYINSIQKMEQVSLEAICESDSNLLAKKAALYNLNDSSCYTDYKKMLAQNEIDAVCICTQSDRHKETVVASLNAGKDVFCAGPMALNTDDCMDIVNVTNKSSQLFMIDHPARFYPTFMFAKKMCDSGEIGDIIYIESEYVCNGRNKLFKSDENIILEGGYVAVDLMRWFVGNPYEVAAFGNRRVCTDWLYDDTIAASMRFENNVVGRFLVSGGCVRPYRVKIVIHGSEGTISTDDASLVVSVNKAKMGNLSQFAAIPMHDIEMRIPVELKKYSVFDEINLFANSISDNKVTVSDAEDGFNTVAACCAIHVASMTGRKVRPDYL